MRHFEVFVREGDRDGGRRRYLAAFVVCLAALIGLAMWANSRIGHFRQDPVNFATLGPTDLVIQHGLTRMQVASMKLGYIEHFSPPQVGLFGNHQFQYFGTPAFSESLPDHWFFNFWYANLSLTEVRDYLSYLADLGKLPTETVLVQVTTPNNDNGLYIIGYSGELPPDVAGYGRAGDEPTSLIDWQQSIGAVQQYGSQVFNYSNFLFGLASGFGSAERVIDTRNCEGGEAANAPTLVDRLPVSIRNIFGAVGYAALYCDTSLWRDAFRHDGSHDGRFVRATPFRDANPLDPHDTALHPSDVEEIADTLRTIKRTVESSGANVVLIIPPVYETERWSPADRVLTEALALVADLDVVDHRYLRDEAAFFINYDHPSPAYFNVLAAELIERGWVDLP